MKSIIIIAIVLLTCIVLNEALQCYSHDICSVSCPQLANATTTCPGDGDKCYKFVFFNGIKRGCADKLCAVQVDIISTLANVCCNKDFCN